VPVRPDDLDPAYSLLCGDDGTVLARLLLRDEEAEAVRPSPGVPIQRVADQARLDLAGLTLETPDDGLVAALGLPLHRAATELRHDLAELPAPVTLQHGWSLTEGGWDDDLASALAAAYPPGHPDSGWTENDTRQVRAMFDKADPVPPLSPACARLVGPDGRSAGHVLCAGPVPWTGYRCAWVLNLGVGSRAQGRGFGWALLVHALHGSRTAGLPALALAVTDGNPARRLYDRAGFEPVARVLTVRLPTG
jgi:mycothiol synthase